MTIKKFIDRPLLSILINVMVVAVGIIALTISVSATKWKTKLNKIIKKDEKIIIMGYRYAAVVRQHVRSEFV